MPSACPAICAVSRSAIFFEYPRTLTGSAALSVEMFTNDSAPQAAAASSTVWVPRMLLCTASAG